MERFPPSSVVPLPPPRVPVTARSKPRMSPLLPHLHETTHLFACCAPHHLPRAASIRAPRMPRWDHLPGLLQGRVRFRVLHVEVVDHLGDQRFLADGFQMPTTPAIPCFLRTRSAPAIRPRSA